MKAWDVYVPNPHGKDRHIDTVFYDSDCDADYVRRGLVEHDGYPGNIYVKCAKTGETSGERVKYRG